MNGKQIVAIVGTYRKQGMLDQAVDAALAAAREAGARTRKIYLVDQPIEFCRNCRHCTQAPGERRGQCTIDDRIEAILGPIDRADALVFASPVNMGQVTAITRRLFERMVCYTYWPWTAKAPRPRRPCCGRPAAVIATSAMPGPLARLFTGAARSMRRVARLVGARPIGTLQLGLAAQAPDQCLSEADRRRAARLGRRLAGAL